MSTFDPVESRALKGSLFLGLFMLLIKTYAFRLTGSAAVFSDALESVVHLAAVAFAIYSFYLSHSPPDEDHHFGHDKISFFSAGVEGTLIILAALLIVYESIHKWISGFEIENPLGGIGLLAISILINFFWARYLIRLGKEKKSIILESNGHHINSDAVTSLGAVIGLGLASLSGIKFLDPLAALFCALLILRNGYQLLKHSIEGLMDQSDLSSESQARNVLEQFCKIQGLRFHRLRLRKSGKHFHVDFHLQFPNEMRIDEVHRLATQLEKEITLVLELPSDILSHLEPFDIPPEDKDHFDH